MLPYLFDGRSHVNIGASVCRGKSRGKSNYMNQAQFSFRKSGMENFTLNSGVKLWNRLYSMTEENNTDTFVTWQPTPKKRDVPDQEELVKGKLYNSKDLTGVLIKDQYFLRNKVSEGNLAQVYQAWDRQRNTLVAVKVLRTEYILEYNSYSYFKNEFNVLSTLSHPNIIKALDFGHYEGVVFIVLEWIQGSTLNEKMKQLKKPMSTSEVGSVLKPLCTALCYIHDLNWVHCDIKPSNIMLREGSNDVILMDFGIAKSVGQENYISGTMAYMAPEQFKTVPVQIEVDIYSLGVTVFELLSGGKYPVKPKSLDPGEHLLALLHSNPNPLNQFNPSIHANIVLLLYRSLASDPERRFKSAMEFLNAYSHGASVRKSRHQGGHPSLEIIFPERISKRKSTNIDITVYFDSLYKKIKKDLESVYPPDDLDLLLGTKPQSLGSLEIRIVSQEMQFSDPKNMTFENIKRVKFTAMPNNDAPAKKSRVTIELIHPADRIVMLSEVFEVMVSDHFLDRFFTSKRGRFIM